MITRRNKKCLSFGRRVRSYQAIAEQAIKRPLKFPEEVHHHTESQLVICQDHAYHGLLHRRSRVVKAGGNPNTENVCGRCRKLLPLTEFSPNRAATTGINAMCKNCERLRKRK